MHANNDDALAIFANLPSKRDLLERIDRLELSADSKALLSDIVNVTVSVGGKLISAGRQIIAFVLETVKRFPNTSFGLIVALVMSVLIASVPFIGAVLGPLLAPLLIAFGLGSGALADIKDHALMTRVNLLKERFDAMDSKA